MKEGIFLGFEPQSNVAGEISRYQVWLINTSGYDMVYSILFTLKTGTRKSLNGKLDNKKAESIGYLQKDQLNDGPVYNFDCRAITTQGTGKKQQKAIKVKAQQFFKKVGFLPVVKMEGHIYELFNESGSAPSVKPAPSLKAYTKKFIKERPPETQLEEQLLNLYNIEERASFESKVDLHIEKLTKDFRRLSNSEILALQMRHFKSFMADAIRLGMEEVIIIHGKGSGRLRDHIWKALDDYPEVEGKEGGYHEGFEFGATRVFL
ncbi:MAG: Smr/MutS family protein [Bacteroidota bacterium]